MNDLCTELLKSSDNSNLIELGDCTVPCLFWADDLVLISKTKEGLHELLNILDKYSADWKMKVNIEKTKVVIFNKQGWVMKGEKLYYRNNCLKNVKYFKYLGLTLDANGKYFTAMEELAKKAMRAIHRIYTSSTYNYISLEMLLQTFETMVKPILLYSSELWGYQMRDDNIMESTFVKFCKHILGVHRKTTNIAVRSGLGVNPLKIDTKLNMLMYLTYLREQKNHLLSTSLIEMEKIGSDWLKYVNNLITEHVPDYEHYAYHKPGRITEKTNAVSQEILKQQTRTKLQYQYMNNTWKVRLEESSKLEFYREVKTDHEFEKYLSWVKDRRHKSALTKLRISAHRLHIETGRYKKYDKVSKTYINTPREERTCSSCTNKIEDEYHFLLECSENLDLREKFFESIKGMTVALVI